MTAVDFKSKNSEVERDPDSHVEDRVALQARDVHYDWSDLPIHYAPRNPFMTHFMNQLHIILPAGEYFFVEAFKEVLPLIKDDQLREDVKGFIGQESMHAQAHERLHEYFASKNMDVTPYIEQMNLLFQKFLGPRPSWSEWAQQKWRIERIALIAAIEHYTAVIGKWIIDAERAAEPGLLHPTMLDMLRWHGAEEVEHKSVAFDVMMHLKAGFFRQARTQLVVTVFLLVLYARGMLFLYSIDPLLPKGSRPTFRDWFRFGRAGVVPPPMPLLKQISKYFKKSFHPSELGGVEKAMEFLGSSPGARAAH